MKLKIISQNFYVGGNDKITFEKLITSQPNAIGWFCN